MMSPASTARRTKPATTSRSSVQPDPPAAGASDAKPGRTSSIAKAGPVSQAWDRTAAGAAATGVDPSLIVSGQADAAKSACFGAPRKRPDQAGAVRSAVTAGAVVALGEGMRRRQEEHTKQAVSAEAAPAPDPVEELKKLAALKDRGILTEEEFTAQKAKILGE